MNYRLNKISNEDVTDRAADILKSVARNVCNLRVDDATCAIGLAIMQSCVEISASTSGRIDTDTVMGMIYSNAAKAMKIHKQIKQWN